MKPDDVLEHFGIPGMHWGKKKGAQISTVMAESHQKKLESQSADHKTKVSLKKKKVSEMSNDELRALTNRLQLEKQYKDLTKQDVSKGQKFVTDLLTDVLKETLKGELKGAIKNPKKITKFIK